MKQLVTFMMDEGDYKKLKKSAYKRECSTAELIRDCISKGIDLK